ncbi:LOW QUALITY PROTEIN: acetoacetyl-CoA synthetase-like [Penaeus monodon]|uniref:LOW QUALITY PROTEIN: acetoacetyl-CoA synthetase-like n=1 Tax=Penaeus monodon TaxID=6687 RepID=UPI0018A6FD5E|nr:LOW QUALITY PROTEIN: acetoacetyl-CoA synthetase-like [Penaeus monodon]
MWALKLRVLREIARKCVCLLSLNFHLKYKLRYLHVISLQSWDRRQRVGAYRCFRAEESDSGGKGARQGCPLSSRLLSLWWPKLLIMFMKTKVFQCAFTFCVSEEYALSRSDQSWKLATLSDTSEAVLSGHSGQGRNHISAAAILRRISAASLGELTIHLYRPYYMGVYRALKVVGGEYPYSGGGRRVGISPKFVHSSPPSQVVDASLLINDIPRWFSGAKLNFARTPRFQGWTVCDLPKWSLLGNSLGELTSPDFGVTGVLERFTQIEPSVLFTVEAVVYNGKIHDHTAKVKKVVAGLKHLKKVVIVPFVHKKQDIDISDIPNSIFLDDFLAEWDTGEAVEFEQLPFHHPQFIMFSSGTTGVPKCMVHSAGGTLIQIAKEHILHCDLTREDVLTYYTTTGWMMWNWLVVGLFTGCSLFLYDGSPLLPTPSIMWDLVDKLGITVLGTGAKWLAVLEDRGVKPRETHDLSSLRAILSTGSPLANHSFRYVYRDIKEDVLLGSITGGTDIISCFMGSNPTLPVHGGEPQSKTWEMAFLGLNEEGQAVYDTSAELVCTKPFPSMPTHFWNDDGEIKYTKAYFAKYPRTWTHGDFVTFNSKTGGITMLGRSDGTLNPNGVRFGSAEIYNIVEQFDEINDSVCVGQRNAEGEERVVLFLKMLPPAELTPEFKRRLAVAIRTQLSARHVPSVILPISEVPYTVSGKKVEVAVRQVIQGETVGNRAALSNPDSLDLYANLPELQGW